MHLYSPCNHNSLTPHAWLAAKACKSFKYEELFARFAAKFVEWRDKLETELKLYLTLGVDNLNRELYDLRNDVKALSALFSQFATRQEKEMKDLIYQKGGPQVVMKDDPGLQELVQKPGMSAGSVIDLSQLRQECQEDLNTSLMKNMKVFNLKLEMQTRELKELEKAVIRESDRVIYSVHTAASAAHRIKDPVGAVTDTMFLSLTDSYDTGLAYRLGRNGVFDKLLITSGSLESVQGWKGNVKARHFVLAVHDYFSEKLIDSPSDIERSILEVEDTSEPVDDDRWALAYINILGVQPILETVDDDATGFVSINEANAFTSAKPMGWRYDDYNPTLRYSLT